MGLLDDLQMGFGLKERTEDYDARTAATIAASEAAGGSNDVMRLAQARNPQHSSFLPASRSRGAQQYLGSRGYDEGYTPEGVEDDDRSILSRLLFSPESTPSPTPYAIGPLTMDQPLPKFGMLGLLSGLGEMFGRGGDEMGPPQTTLRPMLRPEGFTPYVSSGQPETTFDVRTEAEPIDYSDAIPVQDPALIPAIEALALDEATIPLDPTIPPSSLDAVDPLLIAEMGVDKYGRRVPVELPKDPNYITGIDMEFPALSAPPLSSAPTSAPALSPADQMMAIRSSIMRDPKMIGAFETAFGVDMVREALAGLRMVGGVPNVPKAPLTRREQRGLLPTMPITRFN